MSFLIMPAVDILDGKCVRLEMGDYSKVTVYSDNPVDMAKKWSDSGYKYLHVVDLDGAKFGQPKNIGLIKKIARSINIPFEVGGGIRDLDTIDELFDAGVDRVVLGTVAFENLSFIKTMIEKYNDKISVSIDAKKSIILKKGWIETTGLKAVDAAKKLVNIGIKRFNYTDISKDGMMAGPNIPATKKFVSEVKAKVIASGGVTTNEDIINLSKIKGLEGCIVGRALYEGTISIDKLKI